MKKLFTLFIILTLLFIAGCQQERTPPQVIVEPPEEPETPPTEPPEEPETNPLAEEFDIKTRNFEVGVSGFIAQNYPNPSNADMQAFIASIPEYGELYGIHSGWNDNLQNGIPQQINVIYQVLKGKDTTPYIVLGFNNELAGANFIQQNGDAYRDVAIAIAETYQPETLLLGNEINIYYEATPEGYEEFVTWYAETRAQIKAISPNTKIGTVFQYEFLKGDAIKTGPHENNLELINDFELDTIGLTTYPYFDYENPEQIPLDYYTPLREYTAAPLFITETGWPTEQTFDVQATETAQVAYLKQIVKITSRENTDALIWVFPHDINSGLAGGIFDSISLKENNGEEKQAWDYWEALQTIPLE